MMDSPLLTLFTIIISWNLVLSQNVPGNYYNSPSVSRDKPSTFTIGCDCFSVPNCFGNCSAVSDLVPLLRESSQFLQTFPTPFSVTRPQQFRKRSFKFDTSTANKRSYFSQAQFRLKLLGIPDAIQIKVRKSSVFSGDGEYLTLSYRDRNGVISEVESTKLEDCFYTGEVDSANSSYVAVDTCSGLRGAIFYLNTIYVILPLSCPSCEPQTAPHIVLPWSPSPIAQNNSMQTFWQPVDVMALMQKAMDSRLPDPTNTMHNIWLEFIVDQNMLWEFNGNSTTTVRYVASVVNLVNLHFRDLPVQIHLLRTQIWNLGNRAPIESSIKATLNSIQRYRADQISSLHSDVSRRSRRDLDSDMEDNEFLEPSQAVYRQSGSRKADITMLLTDSGKTEFVEGVDHLAIPGSICTPRATAVVRVNVTDFEFRVASLVSKSIAEILGIRSFFCPELYICDENEVFSRGDISRLRLALLSEMSACLRSSNLQERESLHSDTCGNGVIDRGEECEPYQQGLPIGLPHSSDGSFNKSLNSPAFGCCDPKTCLADVHAVCVTGGCCRNCQLVARGRLCRPARDQCDLPEFCSGAEPECPADLYLENGMRCKGGGKNNDVEEEGLCYEGRCPTRSSHCKALWGPNARTADHYCYANMNRKIDSACGDGVVCEEENTMCGLLHCQNGSDEPVLNEARSLSFFNLRTQNENQKIHCQYVASTQKFSYVPEGASCDEGFFCFQNRCIKPTGIALHSKCPKGPYLAPLQDGVGTDFIHPAVRRSLPAITNSPVNVTCAGRGICTNGAFCLCPPGWHGPVCTQRQPTDNQNSSSIKPKVSNIHASVYPDEDIASLIWMYIQAVDKNPEGLTEPAPVNTVYLISILAAVIACVFFCLCAIIFLYRRRTIHNRDFHHVNKRGFNSNQAQLSPPLFDSKSPGQGTATTTAANSMDSMCLCNRNSRPGIASLDDMELHYHSRHSSRNRRHRHGSKNRNRRRKRGGNSSGDSLQAGNNGAIESGPELGGRDDSVKEGKIKFGSMPSYREDKMKNARNGEAGGGIVAVTTGNEMPVVTGNLVVTTSAHLPPPPPLIDFSAAWSMPPPPPPTQQAFVMPTSSGNQVYVQQPPMPWMSPNISAAVTSTAMTVNMAPPVSSSVSSPMPVLASNGMEGGSNDEMMSVQSTRKVMTTSAISTEETEQPIPQVTVIRENSSRQPEKGILKNKHEGGGLDIGDSASANASNSKKRKHSSKRPSSKKHRCASSVSSSSSSTSSSVSRSRTPSSGSSTGSTSSSLSSVSSYSTSRATDDTTSTNFVTSATNSGDEEGGERSGLISDSASTCSNALETGGKCKHKNHRHRRRQSKRKSSSGHRSHSHGHHHHSGHPNRRRQQSSEETSATNTSTTPPTTTTASTSSNSSPCHRRCHRRRRIGASRRYRMSSEEAESSFGIQNHKVPTILCNAEQQTDEISLARAAGAIFVPGQKDRRSSNSSKDAQNSGMTNYHQQQLNGSSDQQEQQLHSATDQEDSEWEEVECTGGSDCEECRKNAAAGTGLANAATSTNNSNTAVAISSWNPSSAVPPTPPSAGGLLSRRYKLPSPPPLPPVTSTPYYCTTQLSPQAEIDPYYQPPMEDGDSYIGEKTGLVSHLKYPGHTEEDDGLISNRGNQGSGLPINSSMNVPSDCYLMKDSDGLTRKNSPGMPYISRHNYQGSDSDFSLSNSVKKSPTPGHHQTSLPPSWLSPTNNLINNQPTTNHLLDASSHNQWLDVAESDASSLPDASCDLVHLAQLSHAARINPNLSDLARQQERIRLGADVSYYSKQQ